MTESEWWAYAADPQPMLEFLPTFGPVSARKLRLFAVACCRLMFRIVPLTRWHRSLIELAERFADSAIDAVEWEARSTWPTGPEAPGRYMKSVAHHACLNAAEEEATPGMADGAALNAAWAATQPGTIMPDDGGKSQARLVLEQALQCELLRDIFGNPFCPISVPSAWQTPAVLGLAQAIYAERENALLPILADALEDAGCTAEPLLKHCRGDGPHVRGCWIVDLLLGHE